MALLIAIGCLTAGVIIGVIATYRFSSASPVKIRRLQEELDELQETHKAYKDNVSDHFSTTAELVQQMTESYRDVYHHLASGAQSLCDHEIANKMLPAGENNRLFQEEPANDQNGEAVDRRESVRHQASVEPPRDYAERRHASGVGALSEEYGLDRSESEQARTGQSDEEKKTGAEEGRGVEEVRKEPTGDQSDDESGLQATEERADRDEQADDEGQRVGDSGTGGRKTEGEESAGKTGASDDDEERVNGEEPEKRQHKGTGHSND